MNTLPVHASWVDDEPEQARRLRTAVPKDRILLDVEIPGASSIARIADRDGVFVDLRNKSADGDGVVLARRIHAHSPGKPIVFVSAFFADASFSRLERRLSPLAHTFRLEKGKLESALNFGYNKNDKDFERRERAKKDVVRVIESFIDQVAASKLEPEEEVIRFSSQILELDQVSFSEMSLRNRAEISRLVALEVQDFLEAVFTRRSDVEWVALDIPSGMVLGWGDESDVPVDLSHADELYRGDSNRGIPMVFHRPSSVDV